MCAKRIVYSVLALIAIVSMTGCSDVNPQVSDTPPINLTDTPSPVPTAAPTETDTPAATESNAPTPTPYITMPPETTPPPVTAQPTINPEQANSAMIAAEECSAAAFNILPEGEVYFFEFEYGCEYAKVYEGGEQVKVDWISGYYGTNLAINMEELPANELIDIEIELFDENMFIYKRLTISNLYILNDISFDEETELNISQAGQIANIEHLIVANSCGDISDIASLVNLKSIGIYHNERITGDIKVVENFTKLEVFEVYSDYLYSNLVGDISVFNSCLSLKKLRLYGCTHITGDESSLTGSAEVDIEKELYDF